MSNSETIKAEIKTIVATVAEAGNVYDYPRILVRPDDDIAKGVFGVLDSSGRYDKGWRVNFVEIIEANNNEERRTQNDNYEDLRYSINVYQEIFDPKLTMLAPSYYGFVATVELIRDALRPHARTATADLLDVPDTDRQPRFAKIAETYDCHHGVIMVRARARRLRS